MDESKLMGLTTRNYKDVILTDEVMERWNSFGIYGSVTDERIKRKLALSYERLAVYLLYEKVNHEVAEKVEVMTFPMVCRIVTLLEDDIMPEEVVKTCESALLLFNIEGLGEELKAKGYPEIDIEAEFVELLSSLIATRMIRAYDDYYVGKRRHMDVSELKCSKPEEKEAKHYEESEDLEPMIDVDAVEVGDYVGDCFGLHEVAEVLTLVNASTTEKEKVLKLKFADGTDRIVPVGELMTRHYKKEK